MKLPWGNDVFQLWVFIVIPLSVLIWIRSWLR